jgi:hypothetical protein
MRIPTVAVRTYTQLMNLRQLFRRIVRKMTPPGNRGSLDTTYRQPHIDPEHTPSGEHTGTLHGAP